MRLFIAINFDKPVKAKLIDIQNQLKEYTIQGRFTMEENLHLTLVFLGEILQNKVETIEQIMNSLIIDAFSIYISGVGRFMRENGDIWWVGVDENHTLSGLYNQLYDKLCNNGFEPEKRNFTPHLTLAREAKLRPDFNRTVFSDSISSIPFAVTKISLMKSERIAGKLTYTAIYERNI